MLAPTTAVVFFYAAGSGSYLPGDVAASQWVQGFRTPWLDRLAEGLSFLGGITMAIISVGVFAIALALDKKIRDGFVLLLVSLPDLAGHLLQEMIGRPRPTSDLVQVLTQAEGASFPSGHAIHATVFLGFLVYLVGLYVREGSLKLLVRAFLLLLILGI